MQITDELAHAVATFLHDRYEKHSKAQGWKTQEQCRVKFDDLPEANKKVMLAVSKDLLKLIFGMFKLYIEFGKTTAISLIERACASREKK